MQRYLTNNWTRLHILCIGVLLEPEQGYTYNPSKKSNHCLTCPSSSTQFHADSLHTRLCLVFFLSPHNASNNNSHEYPISTFDTSFDLGLIKNEYLPPSHSRRNSHTHPFMTFERCFDCVGFSSVFLKKGDNALELESCFV